MLNLRVLAVQHDTLDDAQGAKREQNHRKRSAKPEEEVNFDKWANFVIRFEAWDLLSCDNSNFTRCLLLFLHAWKLMMNWLHALLPAFILNCGLLDENPRIEFSLSEAKAIKVNRRPLITKLEEQGSHKRTKLFLCWILFNSVIKIYINISKFRNVFTFHLSPSTTIFVLKHFFCFLSSSSSIFFFLFLLPKLKFSITENRKLPRNQFFIFIATFFHFSWIFFFVIERPLLVWFLFCFFHLQLSLVSILVIADLYKNQKIVVGCNTF